MNKMEELAMSKDNIFILVITLLLLAPLCQAADPASLVSVSNYAAKEWAEFLKQQIEQEDLTQVQIEEIQKQSESHLKLIAKEYYFLVNEERDQLPQCLQGFFEGVTLSDLREHDKVPATKIFLGKRLLNLSGMNLVALDDDLKNEAPQNLILNTNQLVSLPEELQNLPELEFLALVNNPLNDEAKQKIKEMFPNTLIHF